MVWILEHRRQRSEELRAELAEPLGNHARSDGRRSRWTKDLLHPCDLYKWHSDAYHTHYHPLLEVGHADQYAGHARIPYWAMIKPFRHEHHEMFSLGRWGDNYNANLHDGIVEGLSVHVNFAWDALSRMTAVVKEVRVQSDRDRLDLNAEIDARRSAEQVLAGLRSDLANHQIRHHADIAMLTAQIAELRADNRRLIEGFRAQALERIEIRTAQLQGDFGQRLQDIIETTTPWQPAAERPK